MAESAKYMPVNTGTVVPEFKFSKVFSFSTKRTRAFAYVFIAVFVAFTVFLAFNPSQNPSSPLFTNIFSGSTSRSTSLQANSTSTVSSPSDSVRSQFSSIYSYFFPNNSSQSVTNSVSSPSDSVRSGSEGLKPNSETTSSPPFQSQSEDLSPNPKTTSSPPFQSRSEGLIPNPKTTSSPLFQSASNQTVQSRPVLETVANTTLNGTKSSSGIAKLTPENGDRSRNSTSSGNNAANNQETVTNATSIGGKSSSETSKLTPENGDRSRNSTSPVSKGGNNQETVTNATSIGGKSSSEIAKLTPENGDRSRNSTSPGSKGGNNQEPGDLVKNLLNCNLFDGEWVRDESYPLYKPGSCSLIDEQFNCFNNGRPDKAYQMLKWKPKSCTLPRLDGSHMLQLLRGKRLVFVGDSLNRNMWESLVCILRNSVKDQSKVYEASGRHHFRSEPSYSFVFKDYDCTVEFFVAPFIVRESVTKDKNGIQKETLRLDLIGTSADQYKTADIVVFNTGHWWTHEKTAKGKDYYQEGSHVYNELNVLEAFRKAMTTWGRWVDANINPSKTLVFFRGYSASHFRGGQWNSGGQCDNEVEPIKNMTYLSQYPDKMMVLEKVLRGMKTRVSYLNITRLTDFRKDGHPSIYRKQHYTEQERRSPLHYQDCSHWCLPGVPDAWNEILYAELLAKQYQKQQQKN